MNRLNIFLLFPSKDEDILLLGEDADLYKAIPKQLSLIRNLLQEQNYRLFYNSQNIKKFCDKASVLCKDTYLYSIKVQIQKLLNKKAVNVAEQPFFQSDCNYYLWLDNTSTASVQTDILFKSAAEYHSINTDEETIIISFLYEDPWHRNIIPIIKDAKHYNDLPLFCNIPYFNPSDLFIEWYKAKTAKRTFCLSDVTRFERTNKLYLKSKQRIYKERETNRYWYYDYFHQNNKEHYEVFDNTGKHLGEANLEGIIDTNKKDASKSISNLL